MHSSTEIEAHNGTKMDPDTSTGEKMEAQSWRSNLFFSNLVKHMQPWATETQNLKGPQLTQKFQRP